MMEHYHRPSLKSCFRSETVCGVCGEKILEDKNFRYYMFKIVRVLWIAIVITVNVFAERFGCPKLLYAVTAIFISVIMDVIFERFILSYSVDDKQRNE